MTPWLGECVRVGDYVGVVVRSNGKDGCVIAAKVKGAWTVVESVPWGSDRMVGVGMAPLTVVREIDAALDVGGWFRIVGPRDHATACDAVGMYGGDFDE